MKKRFAVYPGFVTSINDGGRHFISFLQLCRLYRVPPAMCLDMSTNEAIHRLAMTGMQDLIELRPRRDGCYSLTEEQIG